jgi:lipoprotein-releasing system permease protein
MLVIDKTKEVAIFKAMGLGSGGVSRIFQVAGLTIGGVGILAGIALGLLVCAVVERYGYALDPKVYLIDRLPVQIRPAEILLVAGITFAICFVATIYPSLKAAHLKPVDGLRYE